MTIKKSFGLALKEVRRAKRMTQAECSALAEITQAQWSSYELGKSHVTLDNVIKMSKIFNVDPFILIMKSFDHLRFPQEFHLSVQDYEEFLVEIYNRRKEKIKAKLELLEREH